MGGTWTVVLAVASAVVLLANATEKIIAAYKAHRAPDVQQNKRLDELEAWRRDVDRKLNHDRNRLDDIEDGDRATQRALLALLDHGIDGNNIEQMQKAREALHDHLIGK